MIVDYQLLSEEALDRLIDSYILAELGTCNEDMVNLESRREQVRKSLAQGHAVIEYSESSETAYIVSKEKFEKSGRR